MRDVLKEVEESRDEFSVFYPEWTAMQAICNRAARELPLAA